MTVADIARPVLAVALAIFAMWAAVALFARIQPGPPRPITVSDKLLRETTYRFKSGRLVRCDLHRSAFDPARHLRGLRYAVSNWRKAGARILAQGWEGPRFVVHWMGR